MIECNNKQGTYLKIGLVYLVCVVLKENINVANRNSYGFRTTILCNATHTSQRTLRSFCRHYCLSVMMSLCPSAFCYGGQEFKAFKHNVTWSIVPFYRMEWMVRHGLVENDMPTDIFLGSFVMKYFFFFDLP